MRLSIAVFLSGAALMGLEIVGSRVLAPVFGTSIFVWGALITTFLASLSLGYALGGRLADRRPEPVLLGLILAASGCLLWVLFYAPEFVLAACVRAPVPDRFRSLLAAMALFAPPSVLMGTVTPFAVRLVARDVASVGSAAGRLSAISTAGSILGTFAMAFLLIPALPTRPILFGLGLSLLVAASLVPRALRGRRGLAAAVALAAASLAYLSTPGSAALPVPLGTVIYEKETAYHHLRVVDQGTRRGLYFDNHNQGFVEMNPDGPLRAVYADGLAMAWAFSERPPDSAVVIGLGPGMIPSLLSRREPRIATTSIELDPEVVRTATKYFAFTPDANDRVIVGDGRRELDRQVRETDVIFLDAYFGDSVPFHLLTQEFNELCKSRLSPEGVFAANFEGKLTGARNALFWASVKTLKKVYPHVYVFSPELVKGRDTFAATTIVVATRSPDRLDPGAIRERAVRVAEWLGRPAVNEWAAALYEGEMRIADVPLLTDAYSPTDALQHLGKR